MGSIYHANAKTTAKVRQEIQNSKKSIIALSKQYSLNPKTIMKWKKAGRVVDAKSGPTTPKSTVLTTLQEQLICEFRKYPPLTNSNPSFLKHFVMLMYIVAH